jgi:NTP pyrophosphatase (non-canonical NTP hydrolase)
MRRVPKDETDMQRARRWAHYRPKTVDEKLGLLVEECGEVLAAVGKTQRWGLESYNPELPRHERETNREWILRELHDLERAMRLVREALLVGDEGAGPARPPIG